MKIYSQTLSSKSAALQLYVARPIRIQCVTYVRICVTDLKTNRVQSPLEILRGNEAITVGVPRSQELEQGVVVVGGPPAARRERFYNEI